MKLIRLLFLTLLLLTTGIPVLYATIIDITIESGSSPGTISDITGPFPYESTGNTIMPNAYNDNTLWVWDENQNVTLTTNLFVDWVADPSASYVTPFGIGYHINAGTILSSHYVQWDPEGTGDVVATMRFDSNIFGYITTDQGLFDSDSALGLPGVNYNDFAYRGIEPVPHSNADIVEVGATPLEVLIDWRASNPGDWIRLITAESPGAVVPEPTTIALLGVGLVGLAGAEVRRRRKKKAVDNS